MIEFHAIFIQTRCTVVLLHGEVDSCGTPLFSIFKPESPLKKLTHQLSDLATIECLGAKKPLQG